jgi:hypothetical protein
MGRGRPRKGVDAESFIVKGVRAHQWLELNYGGRTYLVAVRSLLDAYIMRNKEKESGKNDEAPDGSLREQDS